jgi:hypothetical protein
MSFFLSAPGGKYPATIKLTIFAYQGDVEWQAYVDNQE